MTAAKVYASAAELPRPKAGPAMLGTEIWLKLNNTPPEWADRLRHRQQRTNRVCRLIRRNLTRKATTLVGALAITLLILVPMMPGLTHPMEMMKPGPEIPPGWMCNFSTWHQRAPMILAAFLDLAMPGRVSKLCCSSCSDGGNQLP